MGETTHIAWTHHTFCGWWGCTPVSEGCQNCYAAALAKRYGETCFGAGVPRRTFGDKHWAEPLAWNRKAVKDGVRRRVFASSMCDVCDREVPDLWRARLWGLISATPQLDWLVLTKRPLYLRDMLPPDHLEKPWSNLWLGATCENQERADERLKLLLAIPAVRHFVSVEPMLGPLDLRVFLPCGCCPATAQPKALDWVIVGGESGSRARPLDLAWVRSLRDQCHKARTPFFFKQKSGLRPVALPPLDGQVWDQVPGVR